MEYKGYIQEAFVARLRLFSYVLFALSLAFIAVLAAAHPAAAVSTVPTKMNFQGRLTDSSGTVVADGLYNMKFAIYDASSGGTLKWSETRETTNRVQVTNGLFTTRLGDVTPLDPTIFANGVSTPLYFEITLANPATATCSTASCQTWESPMSSRSLMTASAYAYNAELLDGLDSTGFVQNQNSAVQTGANLWIGGTARVDTSVLAPTLDTASGVALNIGTTNATGINLNQSVTVAAGKSLTLSGDTRANITTNIPSPTEGMMVYDTTNKQLLVYANGKWQADRSTATKIVGTSASGGTSGAVASLAPDGADYVNTSTTSAQTTINSALTAISSTGGTVYLMEGTYVIDGSINLPNNVTLTGAGAGTVIKLKNSINAGINAITATDATTGGSGTGITVTNLKIDGNKANNSSGTQNGIYMNNIGAGDGASARQGAKLTSLWISNLRTYAIEVDTLNNSIISDNHLNSSNMGVFATSTNNMTIANNIAQGNSRGIYLEALLRSTVTGNTVEGNAYGIWVAGNSLGVTVTGNTVSRNTTNGLSIGGSSYTTVSGNRFVDNGGATTNEAIYVFSASTNNSISDNGISDASASSNNYAIDINDTGSTGNTLSNNTLGGGSINDAIPASNIYNGQTNGSNNYMIQPTGTVELMKATNVTGALSANAASANTFQVKNGSTNLFNVDTTNSIITLGANDTTGLVLVLDTKSSSGDPTGASAVVGAMYYNSNSGKFRCYQNTGWTDCISTATLQTAYMASTGGTTPDIKVDGTHGAVHIQDADTTISGTLFSVNQSNGSGLGTSIFSVDSTGAVSLGLASTTTTLPGNISSTGTISATGATMLFKPSSSASNAFQVQNSSAVVLLSADTSANEVAIGSNTTDTTQVLLQLDSFDTFADTATCGTTTNQGGLYYNTKTNVIRGCVNGAWEDMVSTAGLGLQLFGVLPDSGANPGDIYGVTAAINGPCKVAVGATTTTVSWTGCTAYSGGRKVIVAAGTATTTNSVAGRFQHLCLTGTNSQPALSASGTEVANLATVSFPSATAPILCLADIKFTGANNTITQVYDTRTYTTTDKTFVALNSAIGVGTIVVFSATRGVVASTVTPNTTGIAGVIVATTGAASTSTINAVMATGGPVAVKAIGGTLAQYLFTSATAGYVQSSATKPTEGTGTIYNVLGNVRTAWSGGTACAINSDACAGSVITDIDKR